MQRKCMTGPDDQKHLNKKNKCKNYMQSERKINFCNSCQLTLKSLSIIKIL